MATAKTLGCAFWVIFVTDCCLNERFITSYPFTFCTPFLNLECAILGIAFFCFL